MKSADAPSTVAGRYRRGDKVPDLLRGATVFAAHDEILDRDVLLIVPEVEDIPLVLDAARRAAMVHEPELVKIVDVGDDDDLPYIVTEAPSGTALPLVAGKKALDGSAARAVVGPLANAVAAAAERGVHHGDVRPGLVFVGPHGPQLLGLGIAGLLGHAAPAESSQPSASSPGAVTRDASQISDSAPDSHARADARGLVEVLYACVTGHQITEPVVPAADVDPSVPADIDTIITNALIEHVGSRLPREVAEDLSPWRAEDLRQTMQDRQVSPEISPAAADGAGSAAVRRTSVLGNGTRMPAAVATPGTPPPAARERVRRWDPSGIAAASAAGAAATASGTPPVPPEQPPLPPSIPPHGSGPEQRAPRPAGLSPLASVTGQRDEQHATQPAWRPTVQATTANLRDAKARAHRFRFNPTPVVLVILVVALGWAALWAASALTRSTGPFMTSTRQDAGDAVHTPTDGGSPSASSSPSTAPKDKPTQEYPPPVISSGQQLDPDGDDNEHPEMVDRAFDGDLQTYWTTRTYATADFGGIPKRGIGYALTLKKKTQVSKVYLTTDDKGGKVEIRNTTPDDPAGGQLLASESFDDDFTIKLDKPVVTDQLVIWITKLPHDDDGKFVAHLAEISLS